MIAGNLVVTPQITEVLNQAARLTLAERLLVARYLLDSVLKTETDEEANWQNLGLAALEKVGDNEDDAEAQPISHLRPYGLCIGEFVVPDDFDEPLPDEIQKTFEGE